jgi:hypothetical protein
MQLPYLLSPAFVGARRRQAHGSLSTASQLLNRNSRLTSAGNDVSIWAYLTAAAAVCSARG